MKRIWYYIVRTYISIGLAFYYKKIITNGLENIPKNKAVIFISNHPNALIDPLLIATTNHRLTHFLTQAAVFSGHLVKKILHSVNMLPVYRVKDGIDSKNLKKLNEETFEKCYKILNKKEALLIFAEGSHNFRRKVRPFRKGFIRIAFGAMEKNNNLDIDLIPVGVNYTNVTAYGGKVSVVYGEPISAKPYWQIPDRNEGMQKIKAKAEAQLKLVTNHIDDTENYEKIIQQFNTDEFLYPKKVNAKVKTLDVESLTINREIEQKHFNLLESIVKLNSFIPLLTWKKVKSKINEIEFTSTFRFAIGITVFPLFYFIQAAVIRYFFGNTVGIVYLILSFLSVFVLTKTNK